jgi:glycine/D-amino acid oxidase-like deaminating enzyme
MNLFTPDTWPARKSLLPLYDRLGAAYEVLDGRDIRRRWPCLTPPDDFLGLLDPSGGYSEPAEYVPALARGCRALGVDIQEHRQVVGLLTRRDRAVGVRTPEGDLEADAIISGVHAWTNALWEPAGLSWPIKSFVHQRYLSAPLGEPVTMPPVNADPYFAYVRPAAGGRVLLGAETSERTEHEVTVSTFRMDDVSTPPGVQAEAVNRLTQLMPTLKDAQWESQSVGLICFSMDGEPILGPVAAVPGLFVAGAFHSGGFSYNSVAGILLSEMVRGVPTSVDVSTFSPNRFQPSAVAEYLAARVPQSAAVRRRH